MSQRDGWIAVHRKILDDIVWKSSTPEQKVILISILLIVDHSPNEWEWKGEKFKTKPGQTITSIDSILSVAGKKITTQNIRTALKRFEKLNFLTNESTKTGRLITIIKWDDYQQNNKESNKANNKDLTKTQQRPNKDLTPNNNVNNGNNVNNNKKYSGEIKNFTDSYQKYISKEFKNLAPKITDSLIEKCCDTIDKLIRLDGFAFEDVYKAVQWGSSDDFWSNQLLSLAQLRKKSKNGNTKFVNLFTSYQKKDAPKLNSAEKRLQSNLEVGRRFINARKGLK